jgi:hypothetical protein
MHDFEESVLKDQAFEIASEDNTFIGCSTIKN